MNRLTTFIILFSLMFVSYGQKVKFNKGKSVDKHYYTEINYKNVEGKIIIPVIIEGKTYQFLFDTGAPNLITSELYKKISSKAINKISVNDANGNRMKMEVVSLPLIELGGIVFKDSPAIVNTEENNFIFNCFEIDGIIGSNLVRNSIVQISSKESLLKISNKIDRFKVSSVSFLDMSLTDVQSSPYVWIKMKGEEEVKERVLFDTGAQGFYDLSMENYHLLYEKKVFLNTQEGVGSKGIGLFGVSDQKKQYRVMVSSINILSSTFSNIMSVTTHSKQSRLGSEIFKYGKVTLDFKHKRFYFEPFNESVDLSEKVLGFSPTISGGKVVVGIVWDEDLKNQLKMGDVILKINDKDVFGMDPCDFINKESPFRSAENFEFKFQNSKGEEKEIHLSKQSFN